jgi:hypothetical protein
VSFSELPPSKQWAALKYRGQKLAEVWFKPEGEPFGLTFRVLQKSFQIPGLGQQLTTENLLKTVAIPAEEVESWRLGDISHPGMDGANPELKNPLPPPALGVGHLDVCVRLKPPEPVVRDEAGTMEISPEKWQDLRARWNAILGIEAAMDSLRISMDSLRVEIDGALKKGLSTEEKRHALRNDVANWNKAKSRLRHTVPKVREYLHRSVWAMGAPERKKLDEVYKNFIEPEIPFPQMDRVLDQLEKMQKDRQVLSAHGTTVYQDSKNICSEVQAALRMLQSNSAANANKKKREAASKGKFFKDIRKISGAG